MVTAVHQADVVELSAALLGVGTPEGTVAYRPDHPFFNVLQSNEEFDQITIDISGQTSSLREALAALDAVQLAVDAAAATVEYRVRYGDDDNEEAVRGRLWELAPDPVWELQIIELSSGSFRAKLKALVSSPGARAKALAVAGLAAAVLTAIFPPVGAVATAVVALAVAADAFFPAKPTKEALADRLEAKQVEEREATGVNLAEWDQAVRASFEAGFDRLMEYLEQQRLESIAREDALRAQLEVLTVAVEKLQRAAPLSALLRRMASFAVSETPTSVETPSPVSRSSQHAGSSHPARSDLPHPKAPRWGYSLDLDAVAAHDRDSGVLALVGLPVRGVDGRVRQGPGGGDGADAGVVAVGHRAHPLDPGAGGRRDGAQSSADGAFASRQPSAESPGQLG